MVGCDVISSVAETSGSGFGGPFVASVVVSFVVK